MLRPKPVAKPAANVASLDQIAPKPVAMSKSAVPRRTMPAVVAPMPSSRLMRDVGGVRGPSTISMQDAVAKPAAEFHAKLKPARGGVLDLRATTPKPVAKATVAPQVQPYKVSTPPARLKHTSVAAKSMHSPVKAQAAIPTATPTTVRKRQVQERLATSALMPRSSAINRFHAPAAMKPASSPIITPPMPNRELPAHVASQHEHLSRLLDVMATETSDSHRKKAQPSRASFAASAAAIAIIGGYVWLHNYPQMALSSAADKAGFSASLPSFVPSSYNLKGNPNYAPGLVTLDFSSPSFKDPLKVTQQPTAWDSSSLLDNYVAVRTQNYAAVNGQGLTIFILNGSQQATWINHGIWYSVEGAANLSRDQLLKMAYSF